MFDESFIVDELLDNDSLNMKCDILEKDNNYYIILDVPGYTRDSLKIEYHNGYIEVMGKKEERDLKYLRKERTFGLFKRQFYVGEIDVTKASAKYKDGELSIVIPKPMKKMDTKTILIK